MAQLLVVRRRSHTMFWQSVIGGLKCLTFWQTYVAGLMYLAVVLLPMALFGKFMERGGKAEAAGGCLGILLMPVFQIFGIYIFVLTLAPIILGVADHPQALWAFPWQLAVTSPLTTLKILGVMILLVICLAFIPVLNSITSLYTLALGGTVMIFVVGLVGQFAPDWHVADISLMPGFFFIVGILLASAVSFLLAMLAVTLVSMALKSEDVGHTVALPLGSVFGFIPVFIYGSWLGLQIKALPGFQ